MTAVNTSNFISRLYRVSKKRRTLQVRGRIARSKVLFRRVLKNVEMSEVKQWLMSIGIPGIERLADEFETRGFSTRKSLQYLQDGDLDYIFSSPKRLLLTEKRALDHELRQLKLKSQEPGSTAHLMPKQLQFSSKEAQTGTAEGETATASNSSSTTTHKIDSPLERRKQELVENVSFLEAQISSAEDHLAKLKRGK